MTMAKESKGRAKVQSGHFLKLVAGLVGLKGAVLGFGSVRETWGTRIKKTECERKDEN